jgi:hypothetical protein
MVAFVLAMGAGLWGWLGSRSKPSAPRATQDPEQDYRQAMALVQQHRFVESLSLFESVVEAEPGFSQAHHDYATAMLNAVHQNRMHLGRYEYSVRSAPERVALVRQALAELILSERTAGSDAHARAWAIRTRAQAMGAWGFPWEALVGYRQAEAADPSWTEMTARAERVLDELEHPERVKIPGR